MKKILLLMILCAGCIPYGPDHVTDLEEDYCGSVVMEETSVFMDLKTPDKKYKRVRTYHYYIAKYNHGDTIKCKNP